MTHEKSPAEEYTREEPLVVWMDGAVRLEAFAEAGGVSASGPARISNPQWIVRANGVERGGLGEATLEQTDRDVRDDLTRWYRAHEAEIRAQKRHDPP